MGSHTVILEHDPWAYGIWHPYQILVTHRSPTVLTKYYQGAYKKNVKYMWKWPIYVPGQAFPNYIWGFIEFAVMNWVCGNFLKSSSIRSKNFDVQILINLLVIFIINKLCVYVFGTPLAIAPSWIMFIIFGNSWYLTNVECFYLNCQMPLSVDPYFPTHHHRNCALGGIGSW